MILTADTDHYHVKCAKRMYGEAAITQAIAMASRFDEFSVTHDEALFEQWRKEDPELPRQVEKRIQANAPKAWRFVGEMGEISRTFREAGAPGEFHAAAADIYFRLARFKDSRTPPTLEEILVALTTPVI